MKQASNQIWESPNSRLAAGKNNESRSPPRENSTQLQFFIPSVVTIDFGQSKIIHKATHPLRGYSEFSSVVTSQLIA